MRVYTHSRCNLPELTLNMPAYARKYLITQGADCLVHAVSRCVRRSWLCGNDPYSGKNFDHRREWVRERAKKLVNHFAVEVLAYAVMANHSHFVLWCRPSVAAGWSAEEVARRWLELFGKRGDSLETEVARVAPDAEKIAIWRERLGNVSWFMRCLNEWLARKANAEDECTGRFWEGRFKCQLLEDEGAVLACMAYVDLNPVRAKVATCLEESRLTGVHDRICARRARMRLDAMGEESRREAKTRREKGFSERTEAQARMVQEARVDAERDRWLCRFREELVRSDDRDSAPADAGTNTYYRASKTAHTVLSMRFEDYLELLEWTGRCVVVGKRGSLPESSSPVLERLEIDKGNWVDTVQQYGNLYHRVAGNVENLKRKAAEMGQKWLSGQRKSRWVYRQTSQELPSAEKTEAHI